MSFNCEREKFINTVENVEQKNSHGQLIIFTGPTGSGKDTIRARICEMNPSIGRIVSATTRSIRDEEEAGIHYNFLSSEQFRRKSEAGKFLEVNKYGDNYYGTEKNVLLTVLDGKQLTWVLSMSTVPRLQEIFSHAFEIETAEKLYEKTTIIFVGVPKLLTLKTRYQQRDSNADRNNLLARLKDDWSNWVKYKDHFSNVVINSQGEINHTINQVMTIINERV